MTLRLEQLTRQHLPDVRQLVADPLVLRFTRIPEPPQADFPEQWLARYEAGRAEGTKEGFAAVDGSGAFVGLALAPHIDREAGEAELGYIVAAEFRGRRLAVPMVRLLTDWAFSLDGMERLYLLIDVANEASERVAQGAGYLREGVMRSVHLKGDIRSDTSLWSRLRSDPGASTPQRLRT